jgi:hypothetical protein
MRTTIRLDDRLHGLLRERAARTGRTLGELVEEAIREFLYRPAPSEGDPTPKLTTVGGRGPRPGVDLDDSSGLLDLMEES